MTNDWVRRGARVEEERGGGLEPPPHEAAAVVAMPASIGASPLRTPLPNVPAGWVPLGPSGVLFGQTGGRPIISGRCRVVRVSDDGQRIYVGTANGGLWYSDDAGAGWLPLDALATTGSVTGALAFATALSIGSLFVFFGANADGSLDEVYVGTGEDLPWERAAITSQAGGVGIRVATRPVPDVRAGGLQGANWALEATNLAGGGIVALDRDPDGVVWAAASTGLYRRPAVNRQTWVLEAVPGASARFTDVVVGQGEAGERYRIWAATSTGQLFVSIDGGAFAPVLLADVGFPPHTTAWGPAARIRIATDPSSAVTYALARRNRLWRVSGQPPVAAVVVGVQRTLFGADADGDQSDYDMAIAVSPDNGNTVALAGSAAGADRPLFAASIYRGTMAQVAGVWTLPVAPHADHQLIGNGVHGDVHALRWVTGAGLTRDLWVGCDGGLFRSTANGDPWTFRERNQGLAVLEPQYLAAHDALEGLMIVGTQDNGVLYAESPEAWRLARYGDGGGVAIDPADGRQRAGQHHHGFWSTSLDGERWTLVNWFPAPSVVPAVVAAYRAAASQEVDEAQFYSAPATILGATGNTQLVIGTQRVWYTETWGQAPVRWRSLPSGGDPTALLGGGPGPDFNRDRLPGDEQVVVLRWGNADNLYVLTTRRVMLYRRVAGVWTSTDLYDATTVGMRKAKNWGAQIPPTHRRNDVLSHEVARGPSGSVYVVTGNPDVDDHRLHVWWFDGTSRWLDCRLEVDAPAHALAADPAHPEHIYVGTTVGVFRGTLVPHGAADPTWTWVRFSDGLPEAPVADMAVHAATRTLRVALSGRGVFEVNLDLPPAPPARRVYVRAFLGDLRRRTFAIADTVPTPRAGQARPYTPASYTSIAWDASPDLRVRRAPGTAAPAFSADYTNPGLGARTWHALVIQAALRAVGDNAAAVSGVEDADGVFDAAVNRRFAAATVTPAGWGALQLAVPNTNLLPLRGDPLGENPSYAEANVLVMDEPDTTGETACRANTWRTCVDVVLHTPGWRSVPAAGVSVALLRAPFAGRATPNPAPDLPATWAAELALDRGRLPAARGAWLAGGWAWADAANPFRPLPAAIDGREGGVVTFPVTLPEGRHLLMAVVLNDDDPLATAVVNPYEVARQHHQVTCRSVRVEPEPQVTEHLFQEWHQSAPLAVGFTAPSDNDRKIVEDRSLQLRPKQRLCLDFLERTVASFRVTVPAGVWFAHWEIRDSGNNVVRLHPSFGDVNYLTEAAPARVVTGAHAWAWDGRRNTADGAFVPAGVYRSVLQIKAAGGAPEYTYEAQIVVIGDPYAIHIFGRPKSDAELIAAIAGYGDPFDAAGERIARDCWITVHRGGVTAGHCVFLGQGTIEATRAENVATAGAVSTPHGRVYKGFIRVDPHGSAANADRVQIEDLSVTNGQIALHGGGGPAPLNPYSSPPDREWKDGVQAHIGTQGRTFDDLSVGCTTVSTTTGTCAAPGCTWSGIRSHNSSFGDANLTAGGGGVIPTFRNKQNKRTNIADALLLDEPPASLLAPVSLEGGCPNPDEPLHLQPTFQAAVFGGFRHVDIPFTAGVPDLPARQLRIRLTLQDYAANPLYALYHHAAVLGHSRTDNGASFALSVWRPRKVIRGWNGNMRNLLTSSARVFGNWTIRRVNAGVTTTEATLVGTGEGDWTNALATGHLQRTWTPAAALAAGTWSSVIRYRLRLQPEAAADHAWVPDVARADSLSNNAATLAVETIELGSGTSRWLQGESVVVLRVVP